MAEVLYRLVKESERNEALFDFVWGSVEALDALDEGTANFHLWFLAQLSRLLGFAPGNDYAEGDWFGVREGRDTPRPPRRRPRQTTSPPRSPRARRLDPPGPPPQAAGTYHNPTAPPHKGGGIIVPAVILAVLSQQAGGYQQLLPQTGSSFPSRTALSRTSSAL